MTLARRIDRLLPLLAGVVAFAVYVATSAPTITPDQSGHFVVAADHLGVARHPGYPVWHLVAHGFTRLYGGTFQGYPNPARAVNLMSAFFAALGVALLAMLLMQLLRSLFAADRLPKDAPVIAMRGVAAWSGAMQLAFNSAFWSQALVSETHAFATAWFLLCWWVYARWIDNRSASCGWWAAALTGLGPSISPLHLLLIPVWAITALIAVGRRTGVAACGAALLYFGWLYAAFRVGSADPRAFITICAAFLLVLVAMSDFRVGRSMAGYFLVLWGGLLPYLYLPLTAIRKPPVNSGACYLWEGFWHVVSRGQYERLKPFEAWQNPENIQRLVKWLADITCDHFTLPLVLVAWVPFLAYCWATRSERRQILLAAVLVLFYGFVVVMGANPKADVQTMLIARPILLPFWSVIAGLIGWGCAWLLYGVARLQRRAPP